MTDMLLYSLLKEIKEQLIHINEKLGLLNNKMRQIDNDLISSRKN